MITVVEPQEQNNCRFSLFRMHPKGVETCIFRLCPEVQEIKKSVCDAGIEGGIGTTIFVVKELPETDNTAEEVRYPGDSTVKLNVPALGSTNWQLELFGMGLHELNGVPVLPD